MKPMGYTALQNLEADIRPRLRTLVRPNDSGADNATISVDIIDLTKTLGVDIGSALGELELSMENSNETADDILQLKPVDLVVLNKALLLQLFSDGPKPYDGITYTIFPINGQLH